LEASYDLAVMFFTHGSSKKYTFRQLVSTKQFFPPEKVTLTYVQVIKTGLNVLFADISKFINLLPLV